MRLVVITTCTDRKRFEAHPTLVASSLPIGDQGAVAAAWRHRRLSVSPAGPAKAVYCGRSFREAALASEKARADLQVISGGFGLISAHDEIPSYTLSLVRSTPEFIGARIVDIPFDAAAWWVQIQNRRSDTPLSDLLRSQPDVIVAIGTSSAYLPLVSVDLLSLSDSQLEHLRLIGLSIEGSCPPRLRPCILPYDSRFDGPDGTRPGTRGDFASRALRHFVEEVFSEVPSASLDSHKAVVSKLLTSWRHPERFSRQAKTDNEIIEIIKRCIEVTGRRSGQTLRHLRDVENIACEQGRFRDLFHRASQ